METRHTPGPWRVEDGRSPVRLTDSTGETIGKVYLTDQSTRMRDAAHAANARLIAAGPEMLAALEAIERGWTRNLSEPMALVRAVLARVRGAE